MHGGSVSALEVEETLRKTMGSRQPRSGQHREILDRITGECLDLVGVTKAREEETIYIR